MQINSKANDREILDRIVIPLVACSFRRALQRGERYVAARSKLSSTSHVCRVSWTVHKILQSESLQAARPAVKEAGDAIQQSGRMAPGRPNRPGGGQQLAAFLPSQLSK